MLSLCCLCGSFAYAQTPPHPKRPTAPRQKAIKPVRSRPTTRPAPGGPVRPKPVAAKSAPAQAPMRGGNVDKIVIAGNKKIEADAIRAKLITREGQIYSDDQVRQDIQELFATGFFYNVTVDRTDGPGITFTYTVK
jgi:hypothetical protein